VSRWATALRGAHLRAPCSCAHGACDRCLVRRGLLARPSALDDEARAERAHLAATLDSLAAARLEGDEHMAAVHEADACATLDALVALGDDPTRETTT